jgi:hypothetical protein
MSKQFYITTAIDYVNGQPHLGHAYEKIVADVIARSRRSLGQEVFFLTGLDEHGQKVQQAAIAEGKTPQAYCDKLAADWQAFAKKLELTNDDFVRTTDPRHKEIVQAGLAKVHQAGQIYKKTYSGFYSTKEETFLTEKDRRPDGTFDPSYGEVIELKEENYFFKLKEHQQWLIDYLAANPTFVQPDHRRNEVLGFLKNNELEDLCISRPAARLNWGIPLPFDKDFVTYVWFDALVNYISIPAAHGDPTVLSALSPSARTHPSPLYLWPADVHVIGKDIVKFHAVYWPIMLKAMGLPLPKQILVHGWWQKDGAKISKSTGNIVDPIAVIDEWGLDAFRFYVLRELGHRPGRQLDRRRIQVALSGRTGERFGQSRQPLALDAQALPQRRRAGETRRTRRRRRESRGRNARIAQTKPAPVRVAKHLGTCHARQSIRGPDRAVQAGQGPGAGQTARRSALQSDGNLPGAGGFALAVSARHGGENLRATRIDRHAGQTGRRDLGRFARRPQNRRTRALVSAQGGVIFRRGEFHESHFC